jgi:hypothetical protein
MNRRWDRRLNRYRGPSAGTICGPCAHCCSNMHTQYFSLTSTHINVNIRPHQSRPNLQIVLHRRTRTTRHLQMKSAAVIEYSFERSTACVKPCEASRFGHGTRRHQYLDMSGSKSLQPRWNIGLQMSDWLSLPDDTWEALSPSTCALHAPNPDSRSHVLPQTPYYILCTWRGNPTPQCLTQIEALPRPL